MRRLHGWLVLATLTACGAEPPGQDGSETQTDAATASAADGSAEGNAHACAADQVPAEDEIRLKGVSLLSRSFTHVLGPRVMMSVSDPKENLLAANENAFGGNDGLGYGNIYADQFGENSRMTGYFLALNAVAHNAAIQCEYRGRQGMCRCDTESAAEAMLGRAIPYRSFCLEEHREIVTTMVELCQTDYVATVTALMSSVAFAKRN